MISFYLMTITYFREIQEPNLIFVYYLIFRGGLYSGRLIFGREFVFVSRGFIFGGGAYIQDFTVFPPIFLCKFAEKCGREYLYFLQKDKSLKIEVCKFQ